MHDSFAGVRLAVPSDEEAIFKLLCLAHKENGVFPMDERKVREFIRTATEKTGGVIGVIDGEHCLEACLLMTLEQWWYTTEWALAERTNFVHPNYRKTSHAKNLIRFAKWVSDKMNLPLEMGVISNDRTESKVRLYRRQMPYVGAFFLYNSVKI